MMSINIWIYLVFILESALTVTDIKRSTCGMRKVVSKGEENLENETNLEPVFLANEEIQELTCKTTVKQLGNISVCQRKQTSRVVSIRKWTLIYEAMIMCNDLKNNIFRSDKNKEHTQAINYNITSTQKAEEALQTIEVYLKMTEQFFKTFKCIENGIYEKITNYCFNITLDNCFSCKHFQFLKEQKDLLEAKRTFLKVYITFMKVNKYVVIPLTMFFGFVMDGTLIFILFKHKELRTKFNIILLNLAIIDFFGLLTPILLNIILEDPYYQSKLHYYLTFRRQITAAGAFSLMILGIIRIKIISKSMKSPTQEIPKNKCPYFLISFVWVSSAGLSCIMHYLLYEVEYIQECILLLSMWIVLGVIFPIIVTILNCLVSRKIRQSIDTIPASDLKDTLSRGRYKSSRLLVYLCLTIWLTHTPIYLTWFIIDAIKQCFFDELYALLVILTRTILCFTFPLTSVLNPLSVYVTSRKFRMLFKKYIFWNKMKTFLKLKNSP